MSIGNLCSIGKKENGGGSSSNLYLIRLSWYVTSGVYSNIFFWSTTLIENKEELRSYIHTLPQLSAGVNGIPVTGFLETSQTARTPAFLIISCNITQDELNVVTTTGVQTASQNIWNLQLRFNTMISI